MSHEFLELFNENIDYPQNIAECGVPENTLYNYVPNSFLNGFINHVTPIRAIMVERYGDDEDREQNPLSIQQFNKQPHADLSELSDDVLILAETTNSYWLFWYDKDVSDCSIGRVNKTKNKRETVVRLFNEFIVSNELFDGHHYEIVLNGWVSS